MRGFKQILHLSRSIRLKLCNQAHVPLLLKQELFWKGFQAQQSHFNHLPESNVLPFYLCRVFVCCHLPQCDYSLSIYRTTRA